MSETEQRDRSRRTDNTSGSNIGPRQILLGVLVLIALWFMVTNFQKVEVDYIVGSAETPLWLLMLLCVGAGMLIDRGLVVRGRHLDRRNRKKG